MRYTLVLSALLIIGCAPGARAATVLYSNTTTDTLQTFLFSAIQPPYSALGDEIHLSSAGTASQAQIELFNNGDAGTFDATLDFFNIGAPVGALLGTYSVTNISSAGQDVIDLAFDLAGGLVVPQDLIFTVSVSNTSPNMDLGVDMFEPPTVGASDNSFMIGLSGGLYVQPPTVDENVYFQLSGTAGTSAPEASSFTLLGTSLGVLGIGGWAGRRRRQD